MPSEEGHRGPLARLNFVILEGNAILTVRALLWFWFSCILLSICIFDTRSLLHLQQSSTQPVWYMTYR